LFLLGALADADTPDDWEGLTPPLSCAWLAPRTVTFWAPGGGPNPIGDFLAEVVGDLEPCPNGSQVPGVVDLPVGDLEPRPNGSQAPEVVDFLLVFFDIRLNRFHLRWRCKKV
jgi:hypothetical protein